jgi:hypothetical protein
MCLGALGLVTQADNWGVALLGVPVVGLFVFGSHRSHYICGGQGAQLFLRFGIIHLGSMPATFGGLISQKSGAFGHRHSPQVR